MRSRNKRRRINLKHGGFQQGDVIITHTEGVPDEATPLGSKGVVQEGEHTGHKHQFAEPIRMYTTDQDHGSKQWNDVMGKILELTTPQALKHEEHNPITLPPGTFRVSIIQEYDYEAEESRRVAD